MIEIINLGIGNVLSVQNMIKRIGHESRVVNHGDEMGSPDKIILPGIGSFDSAMRSIDNLGFRDVLNNKVLDQQTPILGICLGMQLMTEKSEEGNLKGLCWIKGETKKFNFSHLSNPIKVPHMGWNYTDVVNKNILFSNSVSKQRFYFVHSYYVKLYSIDQINTKTQYGIEFTSSFSLNNIYGVQFHPEKSHKYGLSLLKKYCEI
jgi:imidazole glycerol-phosphate synthase subunit HisH